MSEEPTILDEIVAKTRQGLDRRKSLLPISELWADLVNDPWGHRDLRAALETPGVSVIAEFKRRTPSAGVLQEHASIPDTIGAYENGGAAAVSILTEGPYFWGKLGDLPVARAACQLPLLRKDFIIDTYQIYEAAASGADAVLLIAAVLSQSELNAFLETARSLELNTLVETNNAEEIKRAVDVGAEIIGINNRDLHDFSVDMNRTLSLLPLIPDGITTVSESGIHSQQDLQLLADAGVDAVLIGTTLMLAEDPAAELTKLRAEKS